MRVRMTARQRLMHGFMQYIHNYAMRDIQYEVGRAAEKKRLANEKRRLARKKKGTSEPR